VCAVKKCHTHNTRKNIEDMNDLGIVEVVFAMSGVCKRNHTPLLHMCRKVGYGLDRVSTRHMFLTNVGLPVPFFFVAFFFVENRMGGYYLAAEKKQEESQVSKVHALNPKP
jgi:hypothetical protein